MPRERKKIPPTLLYTETHEETHSMRSLYYTQKSFIIGEHVATSGSTSKQWSANSGQRYRLTDLLATVESSSIPDIWRKYKVLSGKQLHESASANPCLFHFSNYSVDSWATREHESRSASPTRDNLVTLNSSPPTMTLLKHSDDRVTLRARIHSCD